MSIEAMKQALEALTIWEQMHPTSTASAYRLPAITALRQAIQEEALRNVQRLGQEIEQAEMQAQPVEHIVHSNGRYSPLLTRMMNKRNESNIKQTIDLYDSPEQADKQEPWVGLTKEEAADCWSNEAVQAEREACAKVCDDKATEHTWEGCYANECAEAIRARGQSLKII